MYYKYNDIPLPIVELNENKLIISQKAAALLQARPGDRIAVNYLQINNEITVPVIGKANVFLDINAGNKLTKSFTVSFKGMQKTILSKYGYLFTLTEYKEGIFKMLSLDEQDLVKYYPDLEEDQKNICLI